jgi:hypothetical protein
MELFPEMLEKDLWAKFKDNINLDWVERVEHKYCPGWPDIHYVHKNPPASGWIELKVADKLPTTMPYRPAQAPWLSEYSRCGGKCYTLLYCESDQKLRVWNGIHAFDLIKENGPEAIKPAICTRMDSNGWNLIRGFLLARPGT